MMMVSRENENRPILMNNSEYTGLSLILHFRKKIHSVNLWCLGELHQRESVRISNASASWITRRSELSAKNFKFNVCKHVELL